MAIANRTAGIVRLFSAGSAAALAFGLAMPAFAQEAAQAQSTSDDAAASREIVVTA